MKTTPWPLPPEDEPPRFEAEHFQDALPRDAILMSRTGVAHGYDDFYYGEKWQAEGKHPGRPIAQIDAAGVQILVLTPEEKAELAKIEDIKKQEIWRLAFLHDKFTKWEDVRPENHDYLLSLLWIPAHPLSAMEIIAVMASS